MSAVYPERENTADFLIGAGMANGDHIGATIGDRAGDVIVGKDIRIEQLSEMSTRQKLDGLFVMTYESRERISVLRTWLIALTAAVGGLGGVVGILMASIAGG